MVADGQGIFLLWRTDSPREFVCLSFSMPTVTNENERFQGRTDNFLNSQAKSVCHLFTHVDDWNSPAKRDKLTSSGPIYFSLEYYLATFHSECYWGIRQSNFRLGGCSSQHYVSAIPFLSLDGFDAKYLSNEYRIRTNTIHCRRHMIVQQTLNKHWMEAYDQNPNPMNSNRNPRRTRSSSGRGTTTMTTTTTGGQYQRLILLSVSTLAIINNNYSVSYATKNFCGLDWGDASSNCEARQPCPTGIDDECTSGM